VKAVAAVVLVAGLLAAGAGARPQARPTVYAASSLTNVFPKIVSAKYSFAGSDTLAAQIRQGAPADVFASANMKLPQGLHDDKLCSKPVVFTRNALVVIVPTSNPAGIHSIHDLTKHGVKVVVAAPSVPVGAYTRKVLAKLHLEAVLNNVVSEETDVREVLAKIALAEGDAGFVYKTDARTAPGKVKSIPIPASGQPNVRYGICLVAASSHKTAAHAFVSKVLEPRGQRILRRYGFLPRTAKR
jgi:molybdate transport system substrate-binding protein